MKKQIRQISKFTGWIMVLVAVICFISTLEIAAQKKSGTTETLKYYRLSFNIEIKGRGEYTDKSNTKTVSWDIYRTYAGDDRLDIPGPVSNPSLSPAEIVAAIRSGRFTMWQTGDAAILTKGGAAIQIKIQDQIIESVKEKGEGGSFENSTTTTTWQGKGESYVQPALMFTDSLKNSYNVFIPIIAVIDSPQLEAKQEIKFDRSSFGYGNLPVSETRLLYDKKVNFTTIEIPSVKGLISGGKITHDADLPQKWNDRYCKFDSGEIKFKPYIKSSSFPAGVQTSEATIKVTYEIYKSF